MSLLMDALKKAELAKRQSSEGMDDQDGAAADGGLSLEPLQSPPSAPDEHPEQAGNPGDSSFSLASQLEELDARFLEEAAAAARQVPPAPIPVTRIEPPPPPPPPPAEPVRVSEPQVRPTAPEVPEFVQARRPPVELPEPDAKVKAAAQNLFDAKQPEKQESKKGFAILIGVFTVLSIAAIGGYFWWQLQPKSPMIARPAAPPPSAPIQAVAPPAPVAATTTPAPGAVSPAPAPGNAVPALPPVTAAGVPSAPARTPPKTASAADDDDDAAPRPAARQRRAPARAIDPPDEDNPIRITREPLRVDPALSRGYDALNRGELTLAQLEYERARKSDPRNTDVLHGLAAIALRQGRADQAEALYRQIVEFDPQDSIAIAALLNQRGNVDPGATESRLKSLAATQPELAAPHFSLGNLYSRQGRWSEAQQSYFRAFNAEPDNPDILYNLAISLEHLRQNKLAAQYYGLALAAAERRPAGFDKAQAAARLKSILP